MLIGLQLHLNDELQLALEGRNMPMEVTIEHHVHERTHKQKIALQHL